MAKVWTDKPAKGPGKGGNNGYQKRFPVKLTTVDEGEPVTEAAEGDEQEVLTADGELGEENPEQEAEGEEVDDFDETEHVISQLHEVLSISANKLKHITQGRRFTTKRNDPNKLKSSSTSIEDRKKNSTCDDCGETGHWKGDKVCKKPGQALGKRRDGGKGDGKASRSTKVAVSYTHLTLPTKRIV